MSLPGLSRPFVAPGSVPPIEHVFKQRDLQRILNFARHSIDDVVNCPVARWNVQHYYKIGKQIERQHEIDRLERQWNPLGRRTT